MRLGIYLTIENYIFLFFISFFGVAVISSARRQQTAQAVAAELMHF